MLALLGQISNAEAVRMTKVSADTFSNMGESENSK